MKKLIAGNWKMNGSQASASALIDDINTALSKNAALFETNDFLVCPPFVHVQAVQESIKQAGLSIHVGGQDCAATENGAHTGDISAEMLKGLGCDYVILGHSERRHNHSEDSKTVKDKAEQAHKQGLITIICVGEQEYDRDGGYEMEVVGGQLEQSWPDTATVHNLVIAYEPVWAIGTGKTATPDDVRVMHKFIREKLQEHLADSENIRILYGGSVKPENAAELFAVDNVDGGLIGGASLKAEQFIGIASAA